MADTPVFIADNLAFFLTIFITLTLYSSLSIRLKHLRPLPRSLISALIFTSANLILLSSRDIFDLPLLITGEAFLTFVSGLFGGPIAGLITGIITESFWSLSGLTVLISLPGLIFLTGVLGGALSHRWQRILTDQAPVAELALHGLSLTVITSAIILLQAFVGNGIFFLPLVAGEIFSTVIILLIMGKTMYDAYQRTLYRAALLSSQQMYEAIVNSQQEMVSRFRPDGTLTFTNKAFDRFFGADLIGRNYLDFIPFEDRENEATILSSLSSTNNKIAYEHRVIAQDGMIYWKERTNTALINQLGELTEIQSVGRDISARKNAELELAKYRAELEELIESRTASLRESDRRLQKQLEDRLQMENALVNSEMLYRKIFETTGTAMAIINQNRSIALINDEFRQLLRYHDRTQVPLADFLRFVHPDSHQTFLKLLEEYLVQQQEDIPPLSIRLSLGDGEVADTLVYAAIIPETDQVIISLIDITAQILQRKALEEAEELTRLTLDGLSEAIVILNQDGRIIKVNKQWQTICPEHETPGHNHLGQDYFTLSCIPILPEGDSQLAFARGIHSVLAGKINEMEIEYSIGDGKNTRWFTGKVQRFPWSEAPRVIVSHEEITERIRIERELRETRDEIAMILEISQQIVSTIDLQPLLALILEQLKKIIPYDGAGIISITPQKYVFEAQRNLAWLEKGQNLTRQFLPLRAIIRTNNAYVSSDIQQDADLLKNIHALLDDDRSPLDETRSLMGIPLISKNKLLGVLIMTHHLADQYDDEVINLARTYASIAAIAIDNAKLYEQVEQKAIGEERNRLARELHDSVTQSLFSASLIAEVLPSTLDSNPEIGKQGVEQLYQLTQGALAEMRTLLLELRPAGLTEKPLGEILDHLTRAIQSRSKIPITLKFERRRKKPLDPDLQIALYRITQEALNNTVKHSGASEIEVSLYNDIAGGSLIIRDNGRGFDLNSIKPGTIGMMIMHERAEQTGINVDIHSEIGKGTEVQLSWRNNGKTG